jgi:hypothetical protein
MIAPAGGIVNLRGVWMNGGFLGTRCLHCGQRAMLHKSRRPITVDFRVTTASGRFCLAVMATSIATFSTSWKYSGRH